MNELKPCPMSELDLLQTIDFWTAWLDQKKSANIGELVMYGGRALQACRELQGRQAFVPYFNPEPENKPLTIEELRQMDGRPVWCVDIPSGMYTGWHILVLNKPYQDDSKIQVLQPLEAGTHRHMIADYGATWIAYDRPPKKEDEQNGYKTQ